MIKGFIQVYTMKKIIKMSNEINKHIIGFNTTSFKELLDNYNINYGDDEKIKKIDNHIKQLTFYEVQSLYGYLSSIVNKCLSNLYLSQLKIIDEQKENIEKMKNKINFLENDLFD